MSHFFCKKAIYKTVTSELGARECGLRGCSALFISSASWLPIAMDAGAIVSRGPWGLVWAQQTDALPGGLCHSLGAWRRCTCSPIEV